MRLIKHRIRDKETHKIIGQEWLDEHGWWILEELPSHKRIDGDIIGDREAFIGLEDKNGTEIYEDDIVSSNAHVRPSAFRVQFIEAGFCATHPNLEGYPTGINHFYPSVGCCIEVIGNVHENPDLL